MKDSVFAGWLDSTDGGAEGQPPQTNVRSRWCCDTSVIEILWNWWCHYIVVFYSYSRTTWLMDLSTSRKLSSLQKHWFCFLTICRRKFVEYFLICCFMSLQNLCSALHHCQLILSISTVQHKCPSWTWTAHIQTEFIYCGVILFTCQLFHVSVSC